MVSAGWCTNTSNCGINAIGRVWEHYRPPQLPDLTPLAFPLWRLLNQNMYKRRPFTSILHLETTISKCCRNRYPLHIRNDIKDVNWITIVSSLINDIQKYSVKRAEYVANRKFQVLKHVFYIFIRIIMGTLENTDLREKCYIEVNFVDLLSNH